MTTISNYSQRSTFHGVADLYSTSSKTGRLFWIILILSATAASFYGTHWIVWHYQESPLYVNYMVRTELVRITPDLVVCPFNRFDKDAIQRLGIGNGLSEYMQLAYGLRTPYIYQPRYVAELRNNTTFENQLQTLLDEQGLSFSELLDEVSTKCEKVIKYCYATSNFPKFYDCCQNATGIVTPLGKCYRMPGVVQQHSGYGYGVTVVMDASRDNYVSSLSNLHNAGMAVKLAERGKAMGDDVTFLPQGSHVLMPLRAQLYHFVHMPPKYSCDSKSRNVKICMDDSVFAQAEEVCNCSHTATSTTKYPACTPTQMYNCLFMQASIHSSRIVKTHGLSIIRYCRMRCRPPCDYWEFQPTVSYTPFLPPDTMERLGWQNSTLGDWVILDMFYERMQYAVIKHVRSMTFDQLISNVGGQLGLWVGASVLTVAQLIAFLLAYAKELVWAMRTTAPVLTQNGDVHGKIHRAYGRGYGSNDAMTKIEWHNTELLL